MTRYQLPTAVPPNEHIGESGLAGAAVPFAIREGGGGASAEDSPIAMWLNDHLVECLRSVILSTVFLSGEIFLLRSQPASRIGKDELVCLDPVEVPVIAFTIRARNLLFDV
jgi:hypothetical protein